MRATSPQLKNIFCGQLVTSDFDGDYKLTYARAPFEKTIPTDTRFYCGDVALVIDMISVPDSFYTNGFAMIIVPQGSGWVPFRWIKPLY